MSDDAKELRCDSEPESPGRRARAIAHLSAALITDAVGNRACAQSLGAQQRDAGSFRPTPADVARPLHVLGLLHIAASVMIALALPRQASAVPPYDGDVVGECEVYDNVTYNVKASPGHPHNWPIDSLQYVFAPTPSQSTSMTDPDKNIRYFSVSPGSYTVRVRNPGPQGTHLIEAPDCSPPRKGMTWKLKKKNSPSGTIRVGCGQNECDASSGDTPCTTSLPILCIKKSGAGFPLPVPATVDNTNQYNKWSGGVVGTTSATKPPATLAKANALCAQQFGPGWRVAEHHDGWGWYFQAYGGVGDPASRFWVHINDKPGALCWD